MASIILRAFGGMAPSANAKAIDPAMAVYAQNLNQRFTDFRPLPGALVVGAATAGATLYRFETSGGFITRAGQVNFVRGPIPTDATERTYYTGDGLPSVTDINGVVRQLGVPAPASAPSVAVNVTDEFSEDDVEAAKAAALATFTSTIWGHNDKPYVGVSDADIAQDFELGATPGMRRFIVRGALVGGKFKPTNPLHQQLIDDRLGFNVGEFPGFGAVAGYISVSVRGMTARYTAALPAALQAIPDPSDQTGVKKLISAAQAATIVESLNNDMKAANTVRDTGSAKLSALLAEFLTAANGTSPVAGSQAASLSDFYARADVLAEIEAGLRSAANAIKGTRLTYGRPIDNPYVQDIV